MRRRPVGPDQEVVHVPALLEAGFRGHAAEPDLADLQLATERGDGQPDIGQTLATVAIPGTEP